MKGAVHRRQRPEAAIQRAVFQHMRARGARGIVAFHVPNGGYRRPAEAAVLRGLGVVAGVPDVIAIHNGRRFALEIKAEGGRTTDKQLATIAALREAGAFTAIAEGLDRALACLEAWGLLTLSRQRAPAPDRDRSRPSRTRRSGERRAHPERHKPTAMTEEFAAGEEMTVEELRGRAS
jgi:hypothetical protein